jgi:hypothetical protein
VRFGRAALLPAFIFALGAPACAPRTTALSASAAEAAPLWFDYVATDGTRLSSETTRGRATVIALVTTYDFASQVMAREIAELFARHRPRINAGLVVLEPPKNAPLAEAFASALGLPFPVAMADVMTLEGRGPFGDVSATPTTIVLDRDGGEIFRRLGPVSTADLERALSNATR